LNLPVSQSAINFYFGGDGRNWARRSEAVPIEIDHHTASVGQQQCQSAAKSVKRGLPVIALARRE
jgi:hypothetical protein